MPELRTAIQDNLQDISDHLLSCGMHDHARQP